MWTARLVAAYGVAALFSVTVVPTAAAEDIARDGTIRLAWKAPPDCPRASEVLADARSLLVRREAPAGRGPIAVDAVAARAAGNRWTLTLAVGSAAQQLEAASCTDLARAGALFLALLMVPDGEPSTSTPTSQPRAPAPAATTAATPPSVTPSKPNAAALVPETATDSRTDRARSAGGREPSLLVAAGTAIDVGTLPHAGVLALVAVGIRIQRLELMLEGAAAPPEDTSVGGSLGARLMAVSATFKPCYAAWIRGLMRLGPCLPIEGGWIHGEGTGIAQSRSSDSFWWSLGGAVALSLALHDRFEARVDFAALVPLIRPDFTVTGAGRVFEPGVAFRGGTTAVVRF